MNQATTKACVDQRASKPLWQLAFRDMHAQTCYVPLVADVSTDGSSHGGRDAKMFDCLVLNNRL
jgi:hypothetical protein